MTNAPADIRQDLGSLTPSQIRGHYRNKDPESRVVRVMGVVEGYVVARRKGAVPFLMWHKDFLRDYNPAPRPAGRAEGGE